MKSRLTQLLAKPIAIGLGAVAGWLGASGDDTTDLALALAAAIVSILAWAVDLLIHKAETGGVTKRAGGAK